MQIGDNAPQTTTPPHPAAPVAGVEADVPAALSSRRRSRSVLVSSQQCSSVAAVAPLRADTGRVIVVREQPAAARCQCAPLGSGVQWGCTAARRNKLHHVIARFELIHDYSSL